MKRLFCVLTIVIVLGSISGFSKNTALLIGIGNYNTNNTGWSVIHGDNDVALLEAKLKAKGFSVSPLVNNKATKLNIKKALANLVNSAENGDMIYLHFSGHGQLFEDMNGDEKDDMDQSFVCYDACFSPKYKVGGKSYKGQNHFIDDELFPYLNELKRKVGKTGNIIVVFDSCYSGGADRGGLTDDPDPESDVEWSETTRGTDDEFPANKPALAYLNSIKKPGNYLTTGGNITIISACQRNKKNYECKDKRSGRLYGSLTYCISKMLDNNIPFTKWEDYFVNKKYGGLKVFRPSQKPIVESHK